MKHKILSFLLTMLMSMAASVASAYDAKIDGIYYNFDSSKNTATVTYEYFSLSTRWKSDYSGNVIIPESVTYNDVTYSVTSIGSSAFSGCTGLTSITIPESVTSVGEDAFKGCTELTAVHTSNLAAWFGISFANVSSNPLSNAHHLYVDGEEVTEVSIPESITTIGAHTFYGCSEITSVTGGRNLTNIGKSAFYGCEKLKYFYVPGGVKNIEASTFEGCKRMTEVRIGSGVETIGNRAFYDCPLLRIYNYAEFPQNCGTNTFSVVKSNCKLFVHADSQDLYSVHQDWYEFNIQPMDDEALAIENVNVNENDNETLRYEKGVYDLSGRKVNVNDSKLKKGIYIVNGKKTQVR